jgi:uncharacterized membrane protein YeaQ/YmgE (transglycosylase-associated protein family)
MQFLTWMIVGLFAGWITGKNMRGYGYGRLIDVGVPPRSRVRGARQMCS